MSIHYVKKYLRMNSIVIVLSMLIGYQWCSAQKPTVANLHFELQDSVVLIHYDIVSDSKEKNKTSGYSLDGKYHLELLLKKENDPEFAFQPLNISGDIGDVTTTGNDKTIAWNILEELPAGIDDTDFYFELSLIPRDAEVSSTYVWYGAGILFAATSVATYFIVSNPEPSIENSAGKFPPPPGRPK